MCHIAKTKTEENSIIYEKKYNDGTNYLVEVVPDKSNYLQIKTMWKKPTKLIHDISVLHHTPEAVNSDNYSTSNNSILQNKKNINIQNQINDSVNNRKYNSLNFVYTNGLYRNTKAKK